MGLFRKIEKKASAPEEICLLILLVALLVPIGNRAPLGVETTEAWQDFSPPLLATQKIRRAETKKASRPRAPGAALAHPPQVRTSLAEGP